MSTSARALCRLSIRLTGLSCCLLLAAQPAVAQGTSGTGDPEPRIEEIRLADGIYLFRAPSEMDKWTSSNSVVIVGTDEVVVFDSNTLPSTSLRVLAAIRRITPLPVRYLINSHWHMDHWSGNQVYADSFPGLTIIATQQTRAFMERMPSPFFARSVARRRAALAASLSAGTDASGAPLTNDARREMESEAAELAVFEAEILATRRVLPTLTYDDSLVLRLRGRELRLLSMSGDAAGSTVLHLPAEGIVLAGDVLVRQEDGRGAQPWTLNSFDVAQWRDSLRRLEALSPRIIVPGQGPPLEGTRYLTLTRELYERLIAQAGSALAEGAVTLDAVRARVDVEDLRRAFGADQDLELSDAFETVVTALLRKIIQQAHDGVAAPA